MRWLPALDGVEGRAAQSRDQVFRSAANTLASARTDVHALGWAIARMTDRYDEPMFRRSSLPATRRPRSADPIATRSSEPRRVSPIGAALSMPPQSGWEGPLNLLMHGDMGPLTCGLIGTGTSVVQSLIAGGRTVHVWVTEAAPSSEGARTSFAPSILTPARRATVIADRLLRLLSSRRADGDVASRAAIGSRNRDTGAGSAARRHSQKPQPVLVYARAPSSATDPQVLDGSGFAAAVRSPSELTDGTADALGATRPAVFGVRLNPTTDVVRSGLITGLFSEMGAADGASAAKPWRSRAGDGRSEIGPDAQSPVAAAFCSAGSTARRTPSAISAECQPRAAVGIARRWAASRSPRPRIWRADHSRS